MVTSEQTLPAPTYLALSGILALLGVFDVLLAVDFRELIENNSESV